MTHSVANIIVIITDRKNCTNTNMNEESWYSKYGNGEESNGNVDIVKIGWSRYTIFWLLIELSFRR